MAIPAIEPLPPGVGRPYWSVMIPTYNSADLLEHALSSVLAAGVPAEEMQITVVDDASAADDPAAVCERLGAGRVEFVRHPTNIGAPANFTACIRLARGRWVHILHGDDAVLPDFYAAYRRHIDAHPCVMAVGQAFTVDDADRITGVTPPLEDEAGLLREAHALIATQHPVAFPAVVASRAALESVGGFDDRLVHASDWELWTRLALAGPVAVVPLPHALYRQHARSDSTRLQRSATYLTDSLAALDVIVARFGSEDERARARHQGHKLLALMALRVARAQAESGERRRAVTNALRALRIARTPETVAGTAEIVLAVAGDTARRMKEARASNRMH